MSYVGDIIVYILMFTLILGVIGALKDDTKGIGFEFCEGIRQVGVFFIPVAGVMAAIPYLQTFIRSAFSGIARVMGHDPAVWAGIILPPDMGGNILARSMASSNEVWIITIFVAFILGTGVTFGIPASFMSISRRDHKYLSLGILCGLMSCPVGITVCCAVCKLTDPLVRPDVSTSMEASLDLNMTWSQIFMNLLPIWIICIIIALCVWKFPEQTTKVFMIFGRIVNGALIVVFAICVVESYTGIVSAVWPGYGFDPLMADEIDINRGLEIAGLCAMMLGGAYPLMYLIEKYGKNVISKIGKKVGISSVGIMGIVASAVTLVAMFRAFAKMPPIDKVRSSAWALCGGYFLADHLAYCFNFQPTLYGCMAVGKIAGGILAMVFVNIFAKKTVEKMEQQDREAGIIGKDEYMEYEQEIAMQ